MEDHPADPDGLDESMRINKSMHQVFNVAIQRGEVVVIDDRTLQYADGHTETSRIYNYIQDPETGDFHRVALSRDEYYKKHGNRLLAFFNFRGWYRQR